METILATLDDATIAHAKEEDSRCLDNVKEKTKVSPFSTQYIIIDNQFFTDYVKHKTKKFFMLLIFRELFCHLIKVGFVNLKKTIIVPEDSNEINKDYEPNEVVDNLEVNGSAWVVDRFASMT